MNYFGWIDFSRKDRELARDIIAALNDKGAVDEMGIGVIRDAFSDYFFPGTSTIQTSAKYFGSSREFVGKSVRDTSEPAVSQAAIRHNRSPAGRFYSVCRLTAART